MPNKHTPGPWQSLTSGSSYYVCAPRADGSRFSVALVTEERYVEGDSAEQRHNDARLIAAAPELLEACQAALRHLQIREERKGQSDVMVALVAAIKKAKGENND